MIERSSKSEFAINILTKLFDVESIDESETIRFKTNHIPHAKLCRIIEYWIDQCKSLFGEPVTITQTQSLRDAGVDLIVELITSKIKFGFQIKSYGDVNEKKFHKNVNAQIAESRRYNLTQLFIGIAGNLTDEKKQGQKIRGLIAELKQNKDDYLHIIPPEKLLTICDTYETKKHPLGIVMLDLKEGFEITEGLSRSLSNEKRKVHVSMDIHYPDIPKQNNDKIAKFTLKLEKTDLDLLDRLEKLHITGETIEFTKDQVQQFEIEGTNWLHDKGTFQSLTVMPTENYDYVTLHILDDKDEIIFSLEELKFGNRGVGEESHVTLRDENQKALSLLLKISKTEINFSCGVNFFDVDLEQLRQAIEFRQSLEKCKKMQILIPEKNMTSDLEMPKSAEFTKLDEGLVRLSDALLVIQQKTGMKFKIPEEILIEHMKEIITTGHLLREETVSANEIHVTLQKQDAIKFLKMLEKPKSASEYAIQEHQKILDKEIILISKYMLGDFVLKEELKNKINEIEKSDKDSFRLELKSVDANSLVNITAKKE